MLKGGCAVTLRMDPERASRQRRDRRDAVAPLHDDLPADAAERFEALRQWRAGVARAQGVPAYVIFHDATLREIALVEPSDIDALARVQGVGASKLTRYGREVLETLAGR